ncbi:hypothetical protein QYF61_014468 [Mycteria americana]|uniref:ribonuclease H n=1 Tax=Mycteria americana TaxID=33587 RepID=A0AAN7NGK8_MYCAM|nr:hypothetical protein QYF61_014468 [Mycteria americana]
MNSRHRSVLPCWTCSNFNTNWSQRQPNGMLQWISLMRLFQCVWQQGAGITNPKHSPIPATIKKINSAETRTRPQFACTGRGVQYTWNRLPQGWKHSPTIFHGLIQTALEQREAPEHLQYIDDIIMWGSAAEEEVFEKGKKIVQILLKAGLATKQRKVKGPAQDIHFF